ncbi:MAG: LysR family transcriptional regulator [Woeseia sp.]
MMNLRHIEIFHAVYQTGSVSAAARLLHVSQPSVSKVLRHAESRIGLPLFRRVKGRLVPTEEAHVIYREAQELYQRYESLRETTANLKHGDGSLRLAVLPSLGLDVAPSAVAMLHDLEPAVSLDIQTLHNKDILKSLYERRCDLAIGFDAPSHPRLKAVRVGQGNMVVLFRREDFVGAPPELTQDMLASRKLIGLSGSGYVGSLFNEDSDQPAVPRQSITVQTYYVAAALVRHGVGFAIVDEFTARANMSESLDYRPLADMAPLTVYCTFLEDRPLSRLGEKLVQLMKKVIKSSHEG